MAGPHFDALTPRFRRIAADARANTAALCWADRLFFLAAAGEKHEVWRKAYAGRYMTEQVPEWSAVVSTVIELWGPAEIDCFEMAAVYSMADDLSWRMAAEVWCVSRGQAPQLADFWNDPVGVAGRLVGHTLERLDRLAG
jgi:hypothetical protein